MFCSHLAVVDFHATRNRRRPDTAGAHGALSFGHTRAKRDVQLNVIGIHVEIDTVFPNNIAQWRNVHCVQQRHYSTGIVRRAVGAAQSNGDLRYYVKSKIEEVVKNNVPLKEKRKQQPKPPWQTKRVCRSVKKQTQLWKRYERTGRNKEYEEYKKQRNKNNQMRKKSKTRI